MSDLGPLLEEVRRLRWQASGVVRGGLPGAHTSMRRGTSAEFAEYRPYRQGDPLARVDWKLFARTDRAYLRLSPDRAVLPTMVVVDLSASMDFPAGTQSKAERARRLAAALAVVAHSGGDPVGVALATDTVRIFPPRTRGGTTGEIASLLRQTPARGSGALVGALGAAARLCQRLVLISDMLSDEDALTNLLRVHRARGDEAYLVHVVAGAELEPPLGAAFDPEDVGDVRLVNERTRAAYLSEFGRWRDSLSATLRSAGVYYVLSVTGEPESADVRRVVTAARSEGGT